MEVSHLKEIIHNMNYFSPIPSNFICVMNQYIHTTFKSDFKLQTMLSKLTSGLNLPEFFNKANNYEL